jgi:hypothetical protein
MIGATGAQAPATRSHSLPRLICPAITDGDLENPPTSIEAGAFRGVAARYAAPASTFGLELKIAYMLEAKGREAATTERLRRPFYRLAQEPIIWSWWSALQQAPLAEDAMLGLASILNGEPVSYRRKEMFSTGAPGAAGLRYEAPDRAQTWRDDIAASDRNSGDPIKKALYRFARIVAAHPFTDANGRFARAALQAGLARGGLITTPCLALAPAFYLHAGDIRAGLSELSEGCDWSLYFERMGAVLVAASRFVESLPPKGTLPSPTH